MCRYLDSLTLGQISHSRLRYSHIYPPTHGGIFNVHHFEMMCRLTIHWPRFKVATTCKAQESLISTHGRTVGSSVTYQYFMSTLITINSMEELYGGHVFLHQNKRLIIVDFWYPVFYQVWHMTSWKCWPRDRQVVVSLYFIISGNPWARNSMKRQPRTLLS